MKKSYLFVAALFGAAGAVPSSAAVVSLADMVDLSSAPYTVNIGSDASYTFSFVPNGLSDVAMAMTGTGQVYGNGFFSPNSPDPLQIDVTVPEQLSLGQFFNQTGTQSIPYSVAEVFVALRFMTGGQTFNGYAEVGGSYLTRFAYNDIPDGSILTGAAPAAVPEPASWAMMVGGFGLVGGVMRRRQRASVIFA